MKKNKIIKFIKENWYYSLLIIPFLAFCVGNRSADNDIWFLLNNGRYVLNNGIPHTDPFTIHQGLHFVMQQWLSSVIFYWFYKTFGKYGLLAIMVIVFWLITYVYYKLCYLISNDKKKSVFITTIVLLIVSIDFLVTRPQIFTYLILLLETYLFELYIKTDKKRVLIPLPFLSLLLINLHSSMWFLQFVFILPFIVNGLNIKGLTIKRIKIKPILIVALIMFLVGFINPYGIEAITFIFKTYGIENFNASIEEMKPSVFGFYGWKICIFSIIFLIIWLNYNKKTKLDIRFLAFIFGTFLLAAMHVKCIPYYLFWAGYAMSNLKVNLQINNRYLKRFVIVFLVCTTIASIIITIPTLNILLNHYEVKHPVLEPIIEYMQKNYDNKSVKLCADFNQGGYTEYMGYKTYIDPRAELFIAKFNKKEDIFKEDIQIFDSPSDKTIESFLKKYNFTHIIVLYDINFERYLEKSPNYIDEYTKYFDDGEELPLFKLYVRKDISIKHAKEDKKKDEKNEKKQ